MKPLYRIPTMAEVAAVPWNGFRVASCFSGCGGSSLGYKIAGFKVVWANEFVPAARKCYRANHPGTILDRRDIREIDPKEILDAIKNATPRFNGTLDLLDGSPPCSSFSSAGRREKDWGRVKKYSDVRQRTDDLFAEFLRILRGVRPLTCVIENVAGLLKGVSKGTFLDVIKALADAGYRAEARLLDGQWLGVPQSRKRLIFVGVRDDLGVAPAHPFPLPYRYCLADAFAGLHSKPIERESDISTFAIGKEWRKLRPGEQSEKYFSLIRPSLLEPCPTVTQTGGCPSAAGVTHPVFCRKFSLAELRRVCGFPDDFVLRGTYSQNWERLGRAVPPPMMAAVAATVRDRVLRKLTKPLLVGEAPSRGSEGPFSGRSGKALSGLLCWPLGVLGERIDLRNLLDAWPGKDGNGDAFPIERAKAAADRVPVARRRVLLAGKRVASAFGLKDPEWFKPVEHRQALMAVIPHPSGIVTYWNDESNRRRAAEFLRSFLEA